MSLGGVIAEVTDGPGGVAGSGQVLRVEAPFAAVFQELSEGGGVWEEAAEIRPGEALHHACPVLTLQLPKLAVDLVRNTAAGCMT